MPYYPPSAYGNYQSYIQVENGNTYEEFAAARDAKLAAWDASVVGQEYREVEGRLATATALLEACRTGRAADITAINVILSGIETTLAQPLPPLTPPPAVPDIPPATNPPPGE